MNTNREAADAIMVTLMTLCEQKRIAWESAEQALEEADGTVQKGRARFDYNVAHGEHMGAVKALYAARKVFNDHFGVVAIPAVCSCGHKPEQHGKFFKQRPCNECDCPEIMAGRYAPWPPRTA